MPKRSSNVSPVESGPAQDGPSQADTATPTTPPAAEKNAAVALGKLGGKKGGPARAAKLTKEQRSAIAKKAAARWKKKDS